MKIGGSSTKSIHYHDRKAADELKKEMLRYSNDEYSAANTGFDFVIWLFESSGELRLHHAAELLRKEKSSFNQAGENPLRQMDCKSAFQYAVELLQQYNYLGVALVLENHVVAQFGELDDEGIVCIEQLEAVEAAKHDKGIEKWSKILWETNKKITVSQ